MSVKEIFDTLYKTYPALKGSEEDISKAFELLKNCAEKKSLIMVCGNGGSASDSEHIVGELMKGFNLRRPLTDEEKARFDNIEGGADIASKLQGAIKAVSLVSQVGVISAFANDVDASLVFAQQVYGYASSADDTLIALSTSGNSLNIVNAVKAAKAAGIKSVAITGEKESRLSALSDVTIKLPAHTPFEVQEFTLPVYHALCAALEAEIFG